MKIKNLENSMRSSEGNLKHENMRIEEWEKDLVRNFSNGKINRKELVQNVIEGYKNTLEYSLDEEALIDTGYERENNYK